MEIVNVGVGPALNIRIAFYNKKTSRNDIKYIVPQVLNINENMYICIYCNKFSGFSSTEDFRLEMIYEDIYGNKYIQCKDIKVEREGEGCFISIENDFKQRKF